MLSVFKIVLRLAHKISFDDLPSQFQKWAKKTIANQEGYIRWENKDSSTQGKLCSISALELVRVLLSDHLDLARNTIFGVEFTGLDSDVAIKLNLSRINLKSSLILKNCRLPNVTINLTKATLGDLDFHGSEIKLLEATNLTSRGNLSFGGGAKKCFRSSGGINLENSFVGGVIDLRGANLGGDIITESSGHPEPSISLKAQRLICKSSLLIGDGFEASNQVNLNDSRIEGSINARGGFFTAGSRIGNLVPRTALSIKRSKIGGSLLLGDKKISKEMKALPEYVENQQDFSFASFGSVNLVNTEVGGILDLRRSWIKSVDSSLNWSKDFGTPEPAEERLDMGASLYARGFKLGKTLVISNSQFDGTIWFDGAEIGGLFSISNTRVSGVKRGNRGVEMNVKYFSESLVLTGVKIFKNIEIYKSNFIGSSVFSNATVNGDFLINQCYFEDLVDWNNSGEKSSGVSFCANTAAISGVFEMRGVTAKGCFDISSAKIGGDLNIGAASNNGNPCGFEAIVASNEHTFLKNVPVGLSATLTRLIERWTTRHASNLAIHARRIHVDGSLEIGGDKGAFNVDGSTNFDQCKVTGSVVLGGVFKSILAIQERSSTASATVSFRDAKIGESVHCEGLVVKKIVDLRSRANEDHKLDQFYPDRPLQGRCTALNFSHSVVGGSFLSDQTKAADQRDIRIFGAMNLRGVTIGNHADFRGVSLHPCEFLNGNVKISARLNENHWAVDASNMHVKHRFIWRLQTTPKGYVRLSDALVETLDDSRTSWPANSSDCNLERLQYTRFQDRLSRQFTGAEASDSPDRHFRLNMLRSYLTSESEATKKFYDYSSFNSSALRWLKMIKQIYHHHPFGTPMTICVCVVVLFSSLSGWVIAPISILIAVFVFQTVFFTSGGQVCDELEAQKSLFRESFDPSAYLVLSKAYREVGANADADEALVIRSRERYLWGEMNFGKRLLEWGLMWFGFGFKPWMAIIYLTFGVVFGAVFFSYAAVWPSKTSLFLKKGDTRYEQAVNEGIGMNLPDCFKRLTGPGDRDTVLTTMEAQIIPIGYPKFHSVVFSLDVFVPLVDFHQENYWIPVTSRGRTMLWLLKALGWLLSTFTVAALMRQIRS